MSDLILEPTAAAQWQRLIRDSAQETGHLLDAELESYLLMLLQRFTHRTDLVHAIMGRNYLMAQTLTGGLRMEQLRDVGDQCLLFAGLFPGIARRRRVSVDYFVDIGRAAYLDLAHALNQGTGQLFHAIATAFVALMDTLNSIRMRPAFEDLSMLDQADLWYSCGSRAALRVLTQRTGALPMPSVGLRKQH